MTAPLQAPPSATAVRDAATVILWRIGDEGPEALMGTRGATAAFMPNKVVFPGGAVDRSDETIRLDGLPPRDCLNRLAAAPRTEPPLPAQALLAAAIREVWEETGLILGHPGRMSAATPSGWDTFAARGCCPDASAFRFVFRAVTPPGRPRRFDARFFLVPATAVHGPTDDFSDATDELSHLQWVPLRRTHSYELPFITQVVLREIAPLIAAGGSAPEAGVPFVENDDIVSSVTRLA